MQNSSLQTQTIVVVGASSGIGLATAQLAAQAGARVVMISRSQDKLEAAAGQVQGKPLLLAANMLDEAAITQAMHTIGPIHHLLVTAVADENLRRNPLIALSAEQMERSLDKLRGFFNTARAAAPQMQPGGSMTFTSGASALRPPQQGGMSVLAAVNASVIAFAHALSLELAPIRVNTITPGVVDTPVWKPADRERIKLWAESKDLPAQRFGQPTDIADAALFLMGNPYMTGHNLIVDGGLVAK